MTRSCSLQANRPVSFRNHVSFRKQARLLWQIWPSSSLMDQRACALWTSATALRVRTMASARQAWRSLLPQAPAHRLRVNASTAGAARRACTARASTALRHRLRLRLRLRQFQLLLLVRPVRARPRSMRLARTRSTIALASVDMTARRAFILPTTAAPIAATTYPAA